MGLSFYTKASEIREMIKAGEIDGAKKLLDEAWSVAAGKRELQFIAHGLGNEVQRAIFEQYFKDDCSGK